MASSQRIRFDGRVIVHPTFNFAVMTAMAACAQVATGQQPHLTIFCDASMSCGRGRTSVTYQPLAALPNGSHTPVGLAWPVNPLYDIRLGELIALSESLAVATSQIAEFGNSQTGARPAIVVRIFNDNMLNLEYLGGMRHLDNQFLALAKPVLDLIAMRSWAIRHMRPGIQLELHWIPGHGHQVEQHIWADRLAKKARNSGQPFSSVAGHN